MRTWRASARATSAFRSCRWNSSRTFIPERGVKLAILTVPGKVAQQVANRLIECGVQAILNFAPAVLHVPERIAVNNVDLAIQLENLSYFVK